MEIRQALNNAVVQLLRPLVRVLLRHGLAYDEFAELARRTYVDVADRDFALKGRKQTTSRISVITGLNRKEVARLQGLNATRDAGGTELARTMNRAARVVVGWLSEHGRPDGAADLLDAEQFAALVRRHSGDMPSRAVLDELRDAGAVSVDGAGRYQLGREGYGPKATDIRKITLLGQHASELLGAIEHNLSHAPEQAWLQQRVFAEHIAADRADAVRDGLRQVGLQALASARSLLVSHSSDDDAPAPGARRVSIGVYYFEQAAAEAREAGLPAPSPDRPNAATEPSAADSAAVSAAVSVAVSVAPSATVPPNASASHGEPR
jgi:Family of unknown function (DUF6502)